MTAVALILGGARCLWEDFAKALELTEGRERIIVATNFAGRFYKGDIDAWVTLHPEQFAPWRDERSMTGLNTDYRAFAHANRRNPSGAEVWPLAWSGSSGLFGAQVAVEALEAAGAILCGVPMEVDGGHFAEPGDWPLVEKYKPAFRDAHEAGFPIRSMSGWTRELFGEPDTDWLDSLNIGPAEARPRKPKEATMRIKMLKTRNFTPAEERRITVKYVRTQEYTVKREWGEAMVKDGDAEEVDPPARELDEPDQADKPAKAKKAA